MNVPAMLPEILTTPSGPFFIVQNIRDSYLLSALHSYSDTLSVSHYWNVDIGIEFLKFVFFSIVGS